MDQNTHAFAVRVAICAVSFCAAVGYIVLGILSWVHDGVYADRLFQLTVAAVGCLLILIVGAPAVAALLGISVPAVVPPAAESSVPSAPVSATPVASVSPPAVTSNSNSVAPPSDVAC